MHKKAPNPDIMKRTGTGDEGLNRVLDGGLFRGSLAIVQGSPGAGKTILAHQMAFHLISRGESVLYVTMLSESHGRLHCHMRSMSFFNANALATELHYLNGYSTSRDEGPAGLYHLIVTEARKRRVSLVVLDGLFVLDDAPGSETALKRFINDLAMHAELTACTVLMLTNTRRSSASPEYAMVDVWLELSRHTLAYRSIREVEVHKIRGSDFLSGRHLADISRHGLRVYPRLESSLGGTWPSDEADVPLLSTGIAALDEVVGGGLSRGSCTLVLGPTGIGKTSLGLHFLSRCSPAQPGLIVGFYESRRGLIRKARARGIDLESLMATGAVDFIWHAPTEQALDAMAYQVLEHIHRRGTRRLLVDSINAFELTTIHPQRLVPYLSALTNELRARTCSSIFLHELPINLSGEAPVISGGASPVAENILLLRYVECADALRRTLTVIKVRDNAFDPHVREFAMTARGIDLGAPFGRHTRNAPQTHDD